MSTPNELYSKLDQYLRRGTSLEDLETWLVACLPILLDSPSSAVGQLAGAVELLLAEMQAGIRTERSLRGALRRFISAQNVAWFTYPPDQSGEVTTCSEAAAIIIGGLPNRSTIWHIESVRAA